MMLNWLIAAIVFLLLLLVPVGIVILILSIVFHSGKQPFMDDPTNCPEYYEAEVEGKVADIERNNSPMPSMLTVSYQVDGKEYQIEESVKLKSEAIRFCGIPIGQSKVCKIGELKEGDPVRVLYNKANPACALILGSEGFSNV